MNRPYGAGDLADLPELFPCCQCEQVESTQLNLGGSIVLLKQERYGTSCVSMDTSTACGKVFSFY
jgi:hypothetical protein